MSTFLRAHCRAEEYAMQQPNGSPFGGGFRPLAYTFLAGLFVGVFLGWSMHGLIGMVFRVIMFAVAVVIVAFAISFWKGTRKNNSVSGPVDATWRDRT